MGLKTKNVLTKLTIKGPIGFKMMIQSLGENILEGKKVKYFFNCIFLLSPCRFTQMSSVDTPWMWN